jgi:hypothetical protein
MPAIALFDHIIGWLRIQGRFLTLQNVLDRPGRLLDVARSMTPDKLCTVGQRLASGDSHRFVGRASRRGCPSSEIIAGGGFSASPGAGRRSFKLGETLAFF